jgi:hypothetical protein
MSSVEGLARCETKPLWATSLMSRSLRLFSYKGNVQQDEQVRESLSSREALNMLCAARNQKDVTSVCGSAEDDW